MALASELMGLGMAPGLANAVGFLGQSDTLVATGTSQATALALTTDVNTFATVAAGTGALLPPAVAGSEIAIFNNGANALAVFPAVGETINAGAANASFSVTNGKGAIFFAAGRKWVAILSA